MPAKCYPIRKHTLQILSDVCIFCILDRREIQPAILSAGVVKCGCMVQGGLVQVRDLMNQPSSVLEGKRQSIKQQRVNGTHIYSLFTGHWLLRGWLSVQ